MPLTMEVFGIEPRTVGGFPSSMRAALKVESVPLHWMGHVEVTSVDANGRLVRGVLDSSPPGGVNPYGDSHRELDRLVRGGTYSVLPRISGDGYCVFDGGDLAVMASEMFDLCARVSFPYSDRVELCARIIRRVENLPARVMFEGR